MKKNVKKWLLGIAVSATAAFAVVASGCSATDKIKGWFNQLSCEHKTVETVAAKAPTCTEDGHTEYVECVDCGKATVKKVVIESTGHTLETIKGYEATCTTMGLSDGAVCTVCEETVTEQKRIAALGHKKVEVEAKKATCTEDGNTAGAICENGCGAVFDGYKVIPATGHNYVDKICENCGEGHTVLLSDVEVGMDLSGYSLRLTISEEEFVERFVTLVTPGDPSGGYCIDGLDSSAYSICFMSTEDDGYNLFFQVDCGIVIVDFSSGSLKEAALLTLGFSDGSVVVDETVVLDERFSSVKSIQGTSVEAFSCIEFYYVGLPEMDNEATPAATNDVETTAVSYAMNKRAMPAVEELQYGLIVTDKNSDGWTGIF